MTKKELTLKEHLAKIQSKGGKGRMSKLTRAQRSALGKKAAEARWKHKKKNNVKQS